MLLFGAKASLPTESPAPAELEPTPPSPKTLLETAYDLAARAVLQLGQLLGGRYSIGTGAEATPPITNVAVVS